MMLPYILGCLFLANSVIGQNPSCDTVVDVQHGYVRTTCQGETYTLPGDFDTSLLYDNITLLELYCTDENGGVVKDTFPGLPAREKLEQVELHYFNLKPEYPRLNLPKFIGSNAGHVKVLKLDHVKLVTLSACDFAGFARLEDLQILEGRLTSIAVDVFEQLGGGAVGYHPVLTDLDITKNPDLKNLDWSFLKPIAGSVSRITLENNGFSEDTVSASKEFKLTAARNIRLQDNHFKTLPAAIFQTFNPSNTLEIFLRKDAGRFCDNSTAVVSECNCCELAPLAKFLRDNNQAGAVKAINCGPLPIRNPNAPAVQPRSRVRRVPLGPEHWPLNHDKIDQKSFAKASFAHCA